MRFHRIKLLDTGPQLANSTALYQYDEKQGARDCPGQDRWGSKARRAGDDVSNGNKAVHILPNFGIE